MAVEAASYRGAISVYICDTAPCGNAGCPAARLGDPERVIGYGFHLLPREQICCLL